MSEEKLGFEGIIVAAYVDEGAADAVLNTVNDAKKDNRLLGQNTINNFLDYKRKVKLCVTSNKCF